MATRPKDWLEQTRKDWADHANQALARVGYGERIDHRSLAALRDEAERSGDLERAAELSREPNVHLGPLAYRAGDLERAGRGEHREEKTQISGVLERADRRYPLPHGTEGARGERSGSLYRQSQPGVRGVEPAEP